LGFQGLGLGRVTLLLFSVLLDLFMGFKELPYVTRYFLGYLVQFPTSLLDVFVKSYPLLYRRNSA
jgi:hypothetical protein